MFEKLQAEGFEIELKGDLITVRHDRYGEKTVQISDTPADVLADALADQLRSENASEAS